MSQSPAARRRGVVTIWTLLSLPIFATILFGLAEIGRLWQARVELENALETAALAAVQEWAGRGGGAMNVAAAQSAGTAYGRANTVHGIPLDVDDASMVPAAAWSFGTVVPRGTGFDFTPAPTAQTQLAVVIEATFNVPPLSRSILGRWFGSSTVTVRTAAFYDTSAPVRRPRLIRLNPAGTSAMGQPSDPSVSSVNGSVA